MSYRCLTLVMMRCEQTQEAVAVVEVREFEGPYDPTTALAVLAVESGTDLTDVAKRGAARLADVAEREAVAARKALAN